MSLILNVRLSPERAPSKLKARSVAGLVVIQMQWSALRPSVSKVQALSPSFLMGITIAANLAGATQKMTFSESGVMYNEHGRIKRDHHDCPNESTASASKCSVNTIQLMLAENNVGTVSEGHDFAGLRRPPNFLCHRCWMGRTVGCVVFLE